MKISQYFDKCKIYSLAYVYNLKLSRKISGRVFTPKSNDKAEVWRIAHVVYGVGSLILIVVVVRVFDQSLEAFI